MGNHEFETGTIGIEYKLTLEIIPTGAGQYQDTAIYLKDFKAIGIMESMEDIDIPATIDYLQSNGGHFSAVTAMPKPIFL